MAENPRYRSASDEEIAQIIDEVAGSSANGYFYRDDVMRVLTERGVTIKDSEKGRVERILRARHEIDDLGPKKGRGRTGPKPFRSEKKKEAPQPAKHVLVGMPNLGNAIDASYRPDGRKKGGIGPQAPRDLRDSENARKRR